MATASFITRAALTAVLLACALLCSWIPASGSVTVTNAPATDLTRTVDSVLASGAGPDIAAKISDALQRAYAGFYFSVFVYPTAAGNRIAVTDIDEVYRGTYYPPNGQGVSYAVAKIPIGEPDTPVGYAAKLQEQAKGLSGPGQCTSQNTPADCLRSVTSAHFILSITEPIPAGTSTHLSRNTVSGGIYNAKLQSPSIYYVIPNNS